MALASQGPGRIFDELSVYPIAMTGKDHLKAKLDDKVRMQGDAFAATLARQRVRRWLILFVICLTLFLCLGLLYRRAEPWLVAQGYEPFGMGFEIGAEVIGTVLIVGPLAGLIAAICAMGRDRGVIGRDGRTTLHLRDGARRFNLWATLALAILFFAGAWLLVDMGLVRRGIFAAAGVISIAFGQYMRWVHVIYDQRILIIPRLIGKPRRYAWENLTALDWVDELSHHRLTFQKGRKAKLSTSFAGITDLIALAQIKLEENQTRRAA